MDFHRNAGKFLAIALHQLPFPSDELARAFELRQTDRRANVGHAVVVADDIVPVFPMIGEALSLEVSGAFEERLVIGHDHAAFARGDRLVAEEAEASDVAKRTDMLPLVTRTK